MSAFGNLKNDVEKFIADVKTYQDSVAAAIAKAVADAGAGNDVDVTALQAEVDAADAALAPTQAAVVTASAPVDAPVADAAPAPAPVADATVTA